jgi:SAM-dependent methyltransferase
MTDQSAMYEHFSEIADVYRDVRTTDLAPIHHIRDRLALRDKVMAADIGCGAGRYDRLLFEHLPNLYLICIDVNPEMLERLHRYLSASGIRDFESRASRVEELELPDSSLDCVFTFNAVHHFSFPIFLGKAEQAINQGGQIFVYTRTPRQNAQSVWGRHFPDFLEKETRLYDLERMKRWIGEARGLRLREARAFRYARHSGLEYLLQQVRSRHYSTFSLYASDALEIATEGFIDNIRRHFDDLSRIAWHDENTLLEIARD